MNFPVNERKLREDLHEAIDKESMINVIILLMLIRVVQVITWLRPGERELPSGDRPKTIKARDVRITMEDGTEIPATGIGNPTFEFVPLSFPGDPDMTVPDLSHQLQRVIATQQRQLEQVPTTRNINELGHRYSVDAWARNDAGFVSILRVYQNGSADIAHVSPFVAETDGTMLTAPLVSDRELHRLASLHPAYIPANRQGLTVSGRSIYQDYLIEYGPFERDTDWENDVIGASAHQSPGIVAHGLEYELTVPILAYCVTTCGEAQILHRNPGNELMISIYEGDQAKIEAREIGAVYMNFLIAQDNEINHINRLQPGAIFGLTQDYTRDHYGRPVTGQQVLNLAHALDAQGPIDLSEHVGMSLQFSDGLRIQIEEENLGYCQHLAEQERNAVSIENAIVNYRWEIRHNHPSVLPIPMLLAWAKTPGNEVATLYIGTDGVLISDILEKTPKEAALESPEISMTYLRLLYEHDGQLRPTVDVSGYCTPSRGRPWTSGRQRAIGDFPSCYNGA